MRAELSASRESCVTDERSVRRRCAFGPGLRLAQTASWEACKPSGGVHTVLPAPASVLVYKCVESGLGQCVLVG
eukprot:scaffold7360_cov270-Pinguiococcus_pyrenoidosus.AAC.3